MFGKPKAVECDVKFIHYKLKIVEYTMYIFGYRGIFKQTE
jgi:hypothetical protein